MKNFKIFIACPISKYLTENGIDNEFEKFIREIYAHCKTMCSNVFIALEREEFGKKKMYGEKCTVPDFIEMQDTDVLIAFPEDSMGVSVEIGWASVLKKEIVVFIDKKYKQSELVKAINSITPGKRIDIDSSNGYNSLIENIKFEITNYLNNRN